jgi:hypothetical protein
MRRMECTPKTLSTLYGPAQNSIIGETIIALTRDSHLDFRVAEAFEINGITKWCTVGCDIRQA